MADFVRQLDVAGGVLDSSVLTRVAAIAQQSNCVGCDPKGLAEAIANKYKYACSYSGRRRMPPGLEVAVPEDRSEPGTIDVRRPPAGVSGPGYPIVLNLFAQWEIGPPGKYNRVEPVQKDSKEQRLLWFQQCLAAVGKLNPKPPSVAFPHGIGCGLAGGDWTIYERMILEFASANVDIEVSICRLTGTNNSSKGCGGKGPPTAAATEMWDPSKEMWYRTPESDFRNVRVGESVSVWSCTTDAWVSGVVDQIIENDGRIHVTYNRGALTVGKELQVSSPLLRLTAYKGMEDK
jgi:hypothetical protein